MVWNKNEKEVLDKYATLTSQEKFNPDDWLFQRVSENWKFGVTAHEGSCPCEYVRTLNGGEQTYDHEPSEDEINKAIATIPLPGLPDHKCAEGCVWVQTEKEWDDWGLQKHKNKKEYLLQYFRNKQWHCEKPESISPQT